VTRLIAADVGGTGVTVALAELRGGRPAILLRQRFPSAGFASLEALLAEFLALPGARAGGIAAACFAVAGPVVDGRSTLTNLRWRIDAAALSASLGVPVRVLNDFCAAGLGLAVLEANDFATLQHGVPHEHGVRLVVGAGTGLGMAWLTRERGRYVARASEGGHVEFAPRDALQDELLVHLRRSFPRVSAERVISGPGLARIYDFLVRCKGMAPGTALAAALGTGGDVAATVAQYALEQRDTVAQRALDLFVSAYGAYAGDMALATLAHGGVYIAGGIAPKLLPRLEDGTFMRAFVDKGRYRDLLATLPVRVVVNPGAGLLGALDEAGRLVAETR